MFEQDKKIVSWFGRALGVLSMIAMLAFVYACIVAISFLQMRCSGE